MASEHRDVLVLLPTRERLRLVVGVQATGRELFQQVCDLASIREAQLFGLSVVRRKGQTRCPVRGLSRGAVLRGERQGHQRQDGQAPVLLPPEGAGAEVPVRPPGGGLLPAGRLRPAGRPGQPPRAGPRGRYFEPQAYFPPWVIARRGSAYLLRHVPALHREQRGLSPKEAALRFIREACRLEDVPTHFFRLRKDKKEEQPTIVLGLTLRGVQVFQEVNHTLQLLHDFAWSHVGKLAFLGKKFEIWPDGLPSARKLVYYAGGAWRPGPLLHLLRASHQLHLSLQPALQQLRQLEEAEEKKCYRESYVSDEPELDRDPDLASRTSLGSPGGSGGDSGGGRPCPQRLWRLSAGSHCSSLSSGIAVDSQPGETSVDEPPCSSSSSQSSRGTIGGGRAAPQQPAAVVRTTLLSTRDRSPEAAHQGPEAVAGHEDQHSRSLDDGHPTPAPRPKPRSCPLGRALDPGSRRSMNSLTLDLLPEEFVV
uniref:FERM domain containing 1 n=2 Tax=Sus scrofa TaxID=9823 RepID=A0A4X1VYW4_PIG